MKNVILIIVVIIHNIKKGYERMKNKKFVSLLLAIVLCLAMTSSAFASGEGVNRLQRTVAKLREVLPLLVEDLSNDCYLGNMLNVYCINASGTFDPIEYELYPVYSGDAIVALAQVVTNEEGKETISCITTRVLLLASESKNSASLCS